jgi:predicted extracellular nuclease
MIKNHFSKKHFQQKRKANGNLMILVVLLLVLGSCSPWKNAARRNMTVAFYNVENLFDTKDEPGKQDEEFTPQGDKKWTNARYQTKLQDVSKVISSINEGDLPEIVGLAELENEKVLKDLINTGLLVRGKYAVVHHESPDFRGIDCALIYRPEEFKVLKQVVIPVHFKDEPNYKTRDILYVKGKAPDNEVFHIFVNHWPSRIGGLEKTEPNRVEVAQILKSKIDSILNNDSKANIIVMGDMNDEPANKSVHEILGAQNPEEGRGTLVNLMYPADIEGKGTYYYQGEWDMLDNLIVSQSLLDDKGFRCTEEKGFIYHETWMEYKNRDGVATPNRTYGGSNYYGGVSDHFPVYFRLRR